jgi:hypothetical protein
MSALKNKKNAPTVLTEAVIRESQVREIVDLLLRDAFRDHSRDLEEHLNDIHRRLSVLEQHVEYVTRSQ